MMNSLLDKLVGSVPPPVQPGDPVSARDENNLRDVIREILGQLISGSPTSNDNARLVKITGHATITGSRQKYAWTPIYINGTNHETADTAANDVSGTTSENYAINMSEFTGSVGPLVPNNTVVSLHFYVTANGKVLPFFFWAPGPFLAQITSVSGSFPKWSYTGQRVISYDGTSVTTDGINLTMDNGFELNTGTPPYTHATGVTITATDGTVNSTACKIQPIGAGAVVEVLGVRNGTASNVSYMFCMANSAQE